MSEEEIMLEIEEIKRIDRTRFTSSELQAIQGLLDLYQLEKEKNKKWEQIYDEEEQQITEANDKATILELELNQDYISKDKIKEIIEDIDNNKPIIAEQKLRGLLEEE